MANRKWQIANALVLWLVAPALAGEPPAPDPVDRAFAKLKAYDHSQPRQPLALLELHVARSTKDAATGRQVAKRLAALLADPKTTHPAKVFICRQLLLVGTEAQVPLLAKMLDEPKAAEMARRTLEGIPGEASLAALRSALRRLKGKARLGAINSLGIRRDAEAVEALGKALATAEPEAQAAAAEALGKIASREAAQALMAAQVGDKLQTARRDGMLVCARRLAAAGDTATATALYEKLMQAALATRWHVAALSGLVKANKDGAAPLVLKALDAPDAFLQAAALRLTHQLPSPKVTAALVERLAKLDTKGQPLLLAVLAERGDRSAASAALKLAEAKDEAVRVAAVRALAALGDASCVGPLVRLVARATGAAQATARQSLERLSAPGVDEALLAAAQKGDPALRAPLLRILGARRTAGAVPLLLKAASDADARVRLAALGALTAIAHPASYPKLVQLLVAAPTEADARAAEKAILAVGSRLSAVGGRVGPVLAVLKGAPPKAKRSLLRVLARCGGPDALAAVRDHLGDADQTVRDAAVRAMMNWPDLAAAPDLLKLAREAENNRHRLLALRGYLRLAGTATGAATRLKMLESIRQIAKTTEAKRMLLAGLGDVPDAGALEVAQSFLDDPAVRAEAAAAMLRIGKALLGTDRASVREAMEALQKKATDKAVAAQADALHAQALKPPRPRGSASVPAHDKKRSNAMKADVAKRAPKGYRVACYLNCGPDTRDGAKGNPSLRHVTGQPYRWSGADVRHGTIFFTGTEVVFEATGLSPRKSYQLGFSWWDCDHDSRAQSVWAAAPKAGRRQTKLLGATRLPSGVKGQKAAEKVVPIPRALTAGGTVRIVFRNEAAPNCVVSEVWLMESDAERAPPPKPAARKPRPVRVVLVTGIDYPGHKWRQTAPVLAELLEKDPRLGVDIVEKPDFLGSPDLHKYSVIVFHWMNWEKPAPGKEARENFKKYIAGGKGVVYVHFACGAFQDWPEFVEIAGRVWNPKMRGHDPHGTFRVDFTDVKHPITQGMKPFDTVDELYTCLDGKTPMTVLAKATSKVDKKDYPMAFVLGYGKGRIFHCVLGHDVKAFEAPGVRELFRRGAAWAAGVAPVQEK